MKNITTLVLIAIFGVAVAYYMMDTAHSAPTTQPMADASPATRPVAVGDVPSTRPAEAAAPSTRPATPMATASTQHGNHLAQAGNNSGNQGNNQFGNNQNGNNQNGNNQNGNNFGRNRRNGNFGGNNGGNNNSDNGPTSGPSFGGNGFGGNGFGGNGFGGNAIYAMYPNPLPSDVDQVVGMRNIFIKGGQIVGNQGGFGGGGGGTPKGPAGGNLVFIGADDTDNILTAYVEDMDNEGVAQYRVGTSVGGGKITGISLDTLDFTANGQVTHVALGQTLSGASAWSLIYGTTPAATTEAPTGENASVLAKMMQRRAAEMAAISGVKTIAPDSATATQPSLSGAPAGAVPSVAAPRAPVPAAAGATTSPTGGAR